MKAQDVESAKGALECRQVWKEKIKHFSVSDSFKFFYGVWKED